MARKISASMKMLAERILFHFPKKFQTEVLLEHFPLNKDDSPKNKSIFVRQKMDVFLKAHFGGGDESILDMDNTPQGLFANGQKLYTSISHTMDQAVFVLSECPMGVDLEERQRISEAPVKRVCTATELALIPEDTKLLWSIKEAAFKAIPFAVQPQVISDIQILKITLEESLAAIKTYSFSCINKHDEQIKILGFISCDENYQLAVAIILKQ
jgi:phosphopantetheinyl transferase